MESKYYRKKEKIRQAAIEFQEDVSNHSYSWEYLTLCSIAFESLGKKYGLLTEFRENGII